MTKNGLHVQYKHIVVWVFTETFVEVNRRKLTASARDVIQNLCCNMKCRFRKCLLQRLTSKASANIGASLSVKLFPAIDKILFSNYIYLIQNVLFVLQFTIKSNFRTSTLNSRPFEVIFGESQN